MDSFLQHHIQDVSYVNLCKEDGLILTQLVIQEAEAEPELQLHDGTDD